MPRSRKRHHSRSRSKTRSRSHSPPERVTNKTKKPISNEKDGKRRRLDEAVDNPLQKRSVSCNDDTIIERVEDVHEPAATSKEEPEASSSQNDNKKTMEVDTDCGNEESIKKSGDSKISKKEKAVKCENKEIVISDSDVADDKKEKLTTPRKLLTPRQLKKQLESEKKKQQKIREKEEREKQRQDEKAKLLAEKQKLKEQKEAERQKILEEKQKQLELKQKEKEQKEEQKRKEREEKEEQKKKEREERELKRKEKEELEAQQRQEKLKKLQEIEEKNKEKQQKSVALFVNFFKKSEAEKKENKTEATNSNFMPFAVKSDMRLPPSRRNPLSVEDKHKLDSALENEDETMLYLQELKDGKIHTGKSTKTWPYEDSADEVQLVEEDKVLGETICDSNSEVHRMKAKFLYFHENRRPAYFGTWRKNSKFIKPRKPFEEDTKYFNYEEDSDDDWEEEEQGESLDISGDEEEKDTENDEDEYEVDNEFFVPHGHLSDDEIDDEEGARLSPESLKQKLKLLKDEFDEDIKSKTHKLKPRSIGGVWINKQCDNIDAAIYRYLLPFEMIFAEPKKILERSEIFPSPTEKKKVKVLELPIEHIPHFLKIIHGNVNKKTTVVEEFLTFMGNNGYSVDVSKAYLTRFLKKSAQYKRAAANGPMKNKFGWFVKDDIKDKYNVSLDNM